MPTQFDYPETGWSVGKMRKNGDATPEEVTEGARAIGKQSPAIDTIERLQQSRKKAQGISQAEPQAKGLSHGEWQQYWQKNWDIIGQSHKVDPATANPEGIVIDKAHPQIKELQDNGWETYSIPDESWGKGFQFMKPRPIREPLTSQYDVYLGTMEA